MFTLKVSPEYSKPELKQILENLYNLHIDRIMTVNYHGIFKRSIDKRVAYKTNAYKKVFVVLKHNVGERFRTFKTRSLKPTLDIETVKSDTERFISNTQPNEKKEKVRRD